MKNHHSPQLYVNGSFVTNPDYIPGCEGTRLVQRLGMPTKGDIGAFAFGGGLERGGLTDEAWALVSPLCSFEYMGSSEFEMGALPEGFNKFANAPAPLEAYTLTVAGNPEFLMSEKLRIYSRTAKEEIRKGHTLFATVFILAPANLRLHVESVVSSIAAGDEEFLKDDSRLRDTLFFSPSWADDDEDEWVKEMTQGWIELDNGFMFFANVLMWVNFCNLFGVQTPDVDELDIIQPDFSAVNKALESCSAREKIAA